MRIDGDTGITYPVRYRPFGRPADLS